MAHKYEAPDADGISRCTCGCGGQVRTDAASRK